MRPPRRLATRLSWTRSSGCGYSAVAPPESNLCILSVCECVRVLCVFIVILSHGKPQAVRMGFNKSISKYPTVNQFPKIAFKDAYFVGYNWTKETRIWHMNMSIRMMARCGPYPVAHQFWFKSFRADSSPDKRQRYDMIWYIKKLKTVEQINHRSSHCAMKGYNMMELVSDLRGTTHTQTAADATGHVQNSNGHMPLEYVSPSVLPHFKHKKRNKTTIVHRCNSC